MNSNRRTQAERSAATRDALVAAGRELFGARGYAEVGTEEVVRAAGLSRGALYHHFADKAELFAAVLQSVEEMANSRVMGAVTAAGLDDPVAAMRLATAAFLDVCTEPGMARIMLIDAPAVLGAQAESRRPAKPIWDLSCSSCAAASNWAASPRSRCCRWPASWLAPSVRPRCSSPARPTRRLPATRWAPS